MAAPLNEAVEYALGMLHYSACVIVATNGRKPRWNKRARAIMRNAQKE